MDFLMQGVRVPMLCLLEVLALPGWMQTARTVAVAQPECAIAGGFSPLSPGNTVLVTERWS
jgi:hypothetical protein